MKSFDIYLRDRLTECDILISSLTLYDAGLSADSRIMIESCLEKYLLYKVIAVQTGSELVSHIDRMIKTCYEKLQLKTQIKADAAFTEYVWSNVDSSAMVLDAKDIKLTAKSFEPFVDQMEIAVSQLAPLATKYADIRAELPIDAAVEGDVKTDYLTTQAGALLHTEASEIKRAFDAAMGEVEIDGWMKDLLYRVYCSGEHVMQIAASITQTSAVKHMDADTGVEVSLDAATSAQKFEEAENRMLALIDITGVLIKYMVSDEFGTELEAEAGSMLRRKRKLTEIDELNPMPDNSVTLTSLDFIVLEE